MWALDGPSVMVEASSVMLGLEGKILMPFPAFLIEHPKGLVLFDTGMPVEAMEDVHGVFGQEFGQWLVDRGWPSNPEHRIDRQLANIGYRPSDITHVITSHLHRDHIGGHHLFPQAKFYVGQGEFPFAYWPAPISASAFMRSQLDRIRGLDWHEVPGVDLDLFGDGSMTILFMPGHTPGSLCLKVRLPSRTFILTGDAVHVRAALDREFHFPNDADTRLSLQTLRRLKLIRDAEEATVWISHDPDDWAQFGHGPEFHE